MHTTITKSAVIAILGLTSFGAAAATTAVADQAAPTKLTKEQLDKVVAGKPTLDPSPANSTNSCNNGKCNYNNPQGKEIGKPVTGFNN